jgi:hypothetical protein
MTDSEQLNVETSGVRVSLKNMAIVEECRLEKNPKWAEFALSKSFDLALRVLVERPERGAAVFQLTKRFLPNSLASIDHAPGPIIARVTPSVAKMMHIHGSRVWKKMRDISMIATSVPTTGVHKPTRRNIPAAAPTKSKTIWAELGGCPKW